MRAVLAVLLLASLALAGCAKEDKSDHDGDGLTADQERGGWTATVDYIDQRVDYKVTSDPSKADTDGDGLTDNYEIILRSDARKVDTDGDGLTDCQETFHTVLVDCQNRDFNGTGDGGYRTLATRADSDAPGSRYTRDYLQFTDTTSSLPNGRPDFGDGISDYEEVHGYLVQTPLGMRSVQTLPMRADSDNDFLDDGEERFLYRSDPLVPDTDGDGCQDGADVVPHAEESFSPGLLNVTWREPGASGSTNLRWIVNLGGTLLHAGNGLEATSVQHGVTTAVDGDQPFVRALGCSFSPRSPWLPVTVLAERVDGGRTVTIDLRTGNPANATKVYWAPELNVFRWDVATGPDLSGPITFSGAGGSVTFAPGLRLQGS